MPKKIAITKSFMVTRMKKLNEEKERCNFKNVWTSNRRSLHKNGSEKTKVFYS